MTDSTVPIAKDNCVLRLMETVYHSFKALNNLMDQVAGNDTAIANTALLTMEDAVAAVTTPMHAAIELYHHPVPCATAVHSPTVWEKALFTLGHMPLKYQESLAEFSLSALGYSSTWLAASNKVRESKTKYVGEQAESDMLKTALTEFKKGWNEFRPTPEQRQLGLRLAYVTLNEFGDESYNTYHGVHHPEMEKTLAKGGYGDIYLLDTHGNVVYSVFKELDFATNFAADGFDCADEANDNKCYGEWKDSGLGEAFEAGMADPKVTHVIEWKPYGPDDGAPRSFISKGVRDELGTIIGVYVIQMHPSSIPRDSTLLLHSAVEYTDDLLWDYRFGSLALERPPPPSQPIADTLFEVVDEWNGVKAVLEGAATEQGLTTLLGLTDGASFTLGTRLVIAYADLVKQKAPTVPTQQINLSSHQRTLVQGMGTDSIWLSSGVGGHVDRLVASSAEFAHVESQLREMGLGDLTAGTGRRLSSDLATELDNVEHQWGVLEPLVASVAATSGFGDHTLNDLVVTVEKVEDAMSGSAEIFGTTTRTTTLAAVNILAPLPISGSWAGGSTLRLAGVFAEQLINRDQIALKGYDLHHVFFDDKCDAQENSKIVLEEMNRDDTYVALGGVACSEACARSEFVATTLNLPFLAYGCPAPKLSNTAEYKGLTRLGTPVFGSEQHSPMADALEAIGKNYSWSDITIITDESEESRDNGELLEKLLQARNFAVDNVLGFSNNWDELVSIFSTLKESTRGKQRNVFVVGTESFYRRLLCAAIKAEAKEGITWISQGVWRDQWWNRTDMSADFQRAWLLEEAHSDRLLAAFETFNAGWEAYGADDASRRNALTALYHTNNDLVRRADLDTIDGSEQPYDLTHTQQHPIYHDLQIDHGYADIFILDIRGNLIYSVKKAADYGTNFDPSGNGPYRTSGLSNAFKAAVDHPTHIHYIDWELYEPTDAQAAFFSTGIVNADGATVGVYAIELPATYVQSIDEVEEACSLPALRASYEGAINIAGLGKPLAEEMESPLDQSCYKGQSASSFYYYLDQYFETGKLSIGAWNLREVEETWRVPDPYHLARGNAADATCVIAKMLDHFLHAEGYTLEQVQNPTEANAPGLYAAMKYFIKTKIDFAGATGRVKFEGNDRAANLVVQQVRGGQYVEVGVIGIDGNRTWINGGVSDAAWLLEHLDPPPPKTEEFNVFVEVILPFFFVIIPILLLLALSPLLCLVVLFIAKSCAGRMGSDGGGGDGSRA